MKFKRLIPALAMLLVSAILLGTSTFAWFSMNTTVTAANMQVKAVANQGILINEIADKASATWDNEATTSQTEGVLLRATSTADTKTWYSATSKKANTAAPATSGARSEDLNGNYTTLNAATQTLISASAGVSAKQDIYYVDDGTDGYTAGEGYYVKYTYYLKSSADAITLSTAANNQTLNISRVAATGNSQTANLDKALRVAVVIGGKAYIFAPLYAATQADPLPTYYVNASSSGTTPLSHTVSQPTALTRLPATTEDGTPVEVYIYFEGEDVNLKTENVIAALDNLTVAVDFSLVSNTSSVTDSGVTVPNN